MIVPLSRSYTARDGAPTVERVDKRIFSLTFFSACMDCTFCHDACCQYGATIEEPKVRAILDRADELEPFIGRPRSEWFQDDAWLDDPDYPGNRYTRTQVHGERCAFLNRNGRGCLLHTFALVRGIPVPEIKPLACNLFPVLFEDRTLIVPLEIDDGTLVCLGEGPTLYQSARSDLAYQFGSDLVAELDALEAADIGSRRSLAVIA